MDVFEAIHTRRSVRKYTGEPLSEEQLHAILAAGMAGPTAGNSQSWRFVVITDKTLLSRIQNVQPFARMARNSGATILVCGDLTAEQYPGRPFWNQDAAAAMENMLLAAHALGLGACWCAVHPEAAWEQGMRELTGLPEHVRPLGLCVIGHPAVRHDPVDRFDPAKIHYNHW